MNTNASASGYRYWKSLRSTIARPTFTPALNVRSSTAPVFTFRSFVRTNAPPLPGFTCWNSMIWNSTPSSSRVMPFLKSFVETLTRSAPDVVVVRTGLQFDQLARGGADHEAPVGGHLDHVLDAHPAEPRHVDARLDRHDGSRGQGVRGELAPEPRPLVDVEPDPVAEAVREGVTVPGTLDDLSGGGVDLGPTHPLAHGVDAGLLGLADHIVDLLELRGRLTERDRACHVGVVAAGEGAEVHLDHVTFLQGSVTGVVVRLRGVLPEGHDRIERQAVAPVAAQQRLQPHRHLTLAHPDGQRLHDVLERLVGRLLGGAQELELLVVLH